ncbi:ABC transporter ATP-binding protein [Psychrobacillus sp. OK032]|uniref:ABC transporter ATP-binding protein n=1 Tax=Psychrobacillus sp. OK032 TaxID=1884358 RepID=UPI0008CCDFBB|nr:ABC transporter ATP-binding protein [Psychrobacillus sp. OK032]SES40726.1 multiple sugar transport system ATP-binding protein [Psychrobacillus sp. OK032]
MTITLHNISMKFNNTTAVNQLSVTIPKGELVSILGPSGCGKSTTLFMLAGLYEPTGGSILFNDKDVTKLTPEKRGIGMVFQNYALYPHMTVLQNIMFPLKMHKMKKAEAKKKAIEMAKLVEIDHLLDRKPSMLSGGQQQRVAIARALVREPEILLLDEPLSNLDARLRLTMREEIRRIQQALKITTVFVTHDQEEALSISDHVLLMNQGKLMQFDVPSNLYDEPNHRFVASFIGSPSMNYFDAEIVDGTLKTPFGYDLAIEAPNQSVQIAVRPENLYLSTSGLKEEVRLVERVGKDTLAVIGNDTAKKRLFLQKGETVEVGQAVYVQADKDTIRVFQKTGERIYIKE